MAGVQPAASVGPGHPWTQIRDGFDVDIIARLASGELSLPEGTAAWGAGIAVLSEIRVPRQTAEIVPLMHGLFQAICRRSDVTLRPVAVDIAATDPVRAFFGRRVTPAQQTASLLAMSPDSRNGAKYVLAFVGALNSIRSATLLTQRKVAGGLEGARMILAAYIASGRDIQKIKNVSRIYDTRVITGEKGMLALHCKRLFGAEAGGLLAAALEILAQLIGRQAANTPLVGDPAEALELLEGFKASMKLTLEQTLTRMYPITQTVSAPAPNRGQAQRAGLGVNPPSSRPVTYVRRDSGAVNPDNYPGLCSAEEISLLRSMNRMVEFNHRYGPATSAANRLWASFPDDVKSSGLNTAYSRVKSHTARVRAVLRSRKADLMRELEIRAPDVTTTAQKAAAFRRVEQAAALKRSSGAWKASSKELRAACKDLPAAIAGMSSPALSTIADNPNEHALYWMTVVTGKAAKDLIGYLPEEVRASAWQELGQGKL